MSRQLDSEQRSCQCGDRPRPKPDWYPRDEFERAVVFAPGYRCGLTGGRSHGQHGMEVRWYLRGSLGATQFVMFTDWPPSEPSAPFRGRRSFPMAADLGYHSRQPQYEDQEPMACDLIGGDCFYDGSGLNAEPVMERLFAEGEVAVWTALEEQYRYLEDPRK